MTAADLLTGVCLVAFLWIGSHAIGKVLTFLDDAAERS